MCGIVGFINFEGHDREEARRRIKRMADTLAHRGPDEEGYVVDDNAALGHRRLSIIDLSSGQQPMAAAGERVQIVFNGEIYNFMQLRAELQAMGHRFKTRSDTEVILRGYLEWGDRCIEKLNGMFAFGIWDSRQRNIVLARDRVGKKPLYVFHEGPVLAFASEIKALRAGGFCPDETDLEALDCYFSFGYIPAPRTIYKKVRKLPAAHHLNVGESSRSEKKYWNLCFSRPKARTLDDATEEFEALFEDAVKCRLMSEVPLGAFLSGGVDSPLVVSTMVRAMSSPVITNSIGFDDRQRGELPTAKMVAGYLKTDHHEYIVKPQISDVLTKIAWHFDEPFADSSAVPTWYVCQMARQNVTVALSGDGGDESFGGYSFRYIPHLFESRIRSVLPTVLRRLVFGSLGAAWPGSARLPKPLRIKTILENLAVGDVEAFYRDLIWLRKDDRQLLYSADFLDSLRGFIPMETVFPLYSGSDASDALGRSQHTDLQFYMTDDVLAKVDRMSMAHSLEVRSPLLDYRIIEFAAGLPSRLKVNSRMGKLVLRQAFSKRLPHSLALRKKVGFSIPAARWLRQELKPLVEGTIFNTSSALCELLQPKALQRMWAEHKAGSRDHSVFLWGVLMFGLWEQHCSKAPVEAPNFILNRS
jgi:asparagine synthase (glutamine-hydrolysing)